MGKKRYDKDGQLIKETRGRPRLTEEEKKERAKEAAKKRAQRGVKKIGRPPGQKNKVKTKDHQKEINNRLAEKVGSVLKDSDDQKTEEINYADFSNSKSPIPAQINLNTPEVLQTRRSDLVEQRLRTLTTDARQLAIDVHKDAAMKLLDRMTNEERDFCLMISTGVSPDDAVSILFPNEIDAIEKEVCEKFESQHLASSYIQGAIERICQMVRSRPGVRAYLNVLERLGSSRIGLTLEMADERLVDLIAANPSSLLEEVASKIEGGEDLRRIKSLDRWGVAERNAIVDLEVNEKGRLKVKFADQLRALDMFYKRHGGYSSAGEGDNKSGNNTQNVNVQVNAAGEQIHIVAMPGNNGRGGGD